MRRLFVCLLVIVLVAGCRQGSSETGGAIAKQDPASWRKLSKGMTEDQVRAILGDPGAVENKDGVTCWHYQDNQPLERNPTDASKWVVTRGSLLFSAKGASSPKLTEWREP
jgi:outer membrane protein assembly factor BamE (lipoprotein component of BamABCDE complex)